MGQFKFELISDLLGPKYIQEPVGWDTRKPTITRNSTYHGLFRSFTVDLEFVGDGYNYIKQIYDDGGVLADCTLNIYEYDNKKHRYVLQDTGVLDFSTYKTSDKSGRGITLSVGDTGFIEKLKAREDTLINYNSSVDLDGNAMSNPKYVDQTIYGMDVVSIGDITTPEHYATFNNSTITSGSFYSPDISVNGMSNIKDVVGQYYVGVISADDRTNRSFFIAGTTGKVKITGNIKFDARIANSGPMYHAEYAIVQYREGTGTIKLYLYQTLSGNNTTRYVDLDIDEEFDVEGGDKIWMHFRNGNEAAIENLGWIQIYESSFDLILRDKAGETITKGALLFDVFNRSIEASTGVADALDSYITSPGGDYHGYTLQNGLMIRGYTMAESNLSFKFKELFENIDKIFNIGIGITGNIVYLNKKKDFFKDGVIHTIDKRDLEADSFEREVDTDYFFSDIEIGYAKSAYEEVSGLEEYNTKSYYNTIISKINNKLDSISKIRGDGFGVEFARRLQKSDEQTKDSKYDQDIFIINVIQSFGEYIQRTTEQFSGITGIDFTDTPMNLAITPGRNLRRFGWMIAAGLQKYQESNIRFNKSDADTDLTTTLGGVTVSENADISYSELEAPIFTGHKIMFSAPLSLSDYNKIKNDPYRLIKVWNPIEKDYAYGWIKEISIEAVDKATNWELIEAKEATEVLYYWLNNTGGKWLWNNGGGILLNNL